MEKPPLGGWGGMLAGLIEQIQRASLDASIDVDSLLRRVKLAAAKLQLPSLEGWVDSELNGYAGEPPEYRKVAGQPAAWNPYQGWQPIHFDDQDIMGMVTEAAVRESISSLQSLVKTSSGEPLHFPVPPGLVSKLNEFFGIGTPRMIIQLSPGHVVSILSTVRNMVLDWAIEMERTGVIGSDFSFDAVEKAQAKSAMATFHVETIGNFIGNMGSENSTGSITATQGVNETDVFKQLASALAAGAAATSERQALLSAVSAMEVARSDRASFAGAYGRFISVAANHMAIVAPFLPALGAFLL
jgi:hypothetical protein